MKRLVALVLVLIVGTQLNACRVATESAGLTTPEEVQAVALGFDAVRVSWKPAAGAQAYQIERRKDFTGAFQPIGQPVRADGTARITYFDTDLEPNVYYGYRVRSVGRSQEQSLPSTAAGAKTAPQPGVLVRTTTIVATPSSADPDGYVVWVRGGTDSTRVPIGANSERMLSALPTGNYSAVIRGLSSNCGPITLGDTLKQLTIANNGLSTVDTASFVVNCRDPQKASLIASVRVSGDTLDPDGVAVTVSGIIRDANVPANERVYFQTRTLLGANTSTRFDNLRPGDYEITIADVESPCSLEGERRRTLQPKALAIDTVAFQLVCRKPIVPVDTVGRPLILRQAWSSTSARPGDKVSLLTSLDLRARPAFVVSGVSGFVQIDNAVVRFDSARTTRAFEVTASNAPQPGLVTFAAAQTGGEPLGGNIAFLRSWFTVIGANGAQARTSSTISDVIAPMQVKLTSQTRAEEALLLISTTATPTNLPPVAVISGPTSGVAGASLSFSGSQSTDADGSITTYSWSWGDGQTATGVSASKTFATAGTYTVRLTVTDNQGATANREQPVVISVAAPASGTVSGTVSSSLGGGIGGATVSIAGAGSATTAANGSYSFAAVPAGARSLSVGGLPATCTVPAAQSVTVTSGATATVNVTVTCTSGGGPTTGAISGRVTRASDGSGIGFARVVVRPSSGSALAPVSSAPDGAYTVGSVPVGAGSVTVSDLPTGCTEPAALPYSGLAANGSVTVNIAVTCAAPTTGTLTGTITKSTGGAAAGVSVTITPTASAALAPVSTNASGTYTTVAVPAGGGTLTLSALPPGCTAPADLSYSGVVAGATRVRDVVLTCTAAAPTYALTATWGSVTTGGPTGRQVALTVAIDMGPAPGRLDVAGADADPLAGITMRFTYDSTKLAYQSRSLLSVDEFDLGVVGTVNGTDGNKISTVAVASTAGALKSGAFSFVRLTFNLRAGASGSAPMALTVDQALAGPTPRVNVTTSVIVQPLPALTIPP